MAFYWAVRGVAFACCPMSALHEVVRENYPAAWAWLMAGVWCGCSMYWEERVRSKYHREGA